MAEQTIDKAVEMRRAYLREWRKKNPEKVRKYCREYWERKAAKAAKEEHEHE